SPIHSYNELLDLRQAYTWDRRRIFDFLPHVVDYGYMYDIQNDHLPSLKAILAQIEKLCPPNGSDFPSPGLEPDQSIRRILNPAWDPRNPSSVSKFRLNSFWHDGVGYWSLFDILGLFLSSVGIAPNSATTRNFYLPLTAMYGRWCVILGACARTMFN
ncbi:uncharacterized protein N7473_001336, partial [Penicillium subrubescens]|uniref:uncharacterized protein n=1 Tax=Penicillium subrubescens TaxID=1316194 RepID=UPI0025450967